MGAYRRGHTAVTARSTDVDLGVCPATVFDSGADRWVILLPGANYPPTAPLLWYAREAALTAGRNALAVVGTYDRVGEPLAWVEARTEAAIAHVGAAGRPMLVAKSLTSLAAPLAARLGLPAVWLTPLINASGTSVSRLVIDGLAEASAPCLLVGGTADQTWDPTIARSFSRADVLEFQDADHLLQVPGDPGGSVRILGSLTRAVADFIDREGRPETRPGGSLEPAGRLTGIDHVQLAIPPAGETAARAFYGSLLGLREVVKPQPLASRGGCWFVGLGIHLHLGVADDFRPAAKAHPAFTVTDLQALRDRLRSAGVRLTEDHALPHVRRLYATDPFGNRLEFIDEADRGFTSADTAATASAGLPDRPTE